MNCPFHVLVYKSRTRSYRELPIRLSELGTIYRHERLGTLHGLLRIRGGTQDDSHIICTPDQLVDEILRVFDLTFEIHQTFGFGDPIINLSTLPGETILDDEMATRATEALTMALDKSGLPWTEAQGEGTFYGPKVDFHFKDAIGRLWQLTTVQCDFALPERFDMEYVGEDNERHRPVMIHRAILGTLERFSAVLIEHYAGAFPLWLAPEQVRIVPVADRHVEHAAGLAARLLEAGLRASVDESRETVQKKIRAAALMRVPYTIVVGDKDIEAGTVSVRDRGEHDVRGVGLRSVRRGRCPGGGHALTRGRRPDLAHLRHRWIGSGRPGAWSTSRPPSTTTSNASCALSRRRTMTSGTSSCGAPRTRSRASTSIRTTPAIC